MHKWLISVAVGLWSMLGLASPASDLFREASFYLEFYYYGPSNKKPADLTAQYQRSLEAACLPYGEQCSFAVAEPLIEQMLGELRDGHTYYLSPEELARARATFDGIVPPQRLAGLRLGYANSRGEVIISEILAQSAAQKAGLQPGDRIARFNDQPGNTYGLASLLASGQPVTLEVVRGPSANPQRFTVVLGAELSLALELPYLYPLPGHPGVMVLRIPQFATYNQVGPAVHALVRQAQVAQATALLVDLRGNSGGEETECISATAAFIGDYQVYMQSKHAQYPLGFEDGQTVGNDPRDPRSYRIDPPALWSGPVATLVNIRSASCAELFAYLLQRAGRGPVVGERTLGVLNTATDYFPLINQAALAITYIQTFNADGTPFPDLVEPNLRVLDSPLTWAEDGVDRVAVRALEALQK